MASAQRVASTKGGYLIYGGEWMKTAIITVGRAAVERVAGGRPSALRALAAAAVTGGATATLTYRLLRSEGDQSEG